MSVDINWATLLDTVPEAVERTLIPPDRYSTRVVKSEAGTSAAGNPKIELTMEVDEGPHIGQWVWGRINFATSSPKSMAVTVKHLAEFGITREWLAQNSPTMAQIATKLDGKRISVSVKHREYEGKTYYDVSGYQRIDDPAASMAVF